MAKKTTRKKARNVGPSLEERQLKVQKQELERGLRQQRRVRDLARALRSATARADADLRNLTRSLMDRLPPVRPSAEDHPESAVE